MILDGKETAKALEEKLKKQIAESKKEGFIPKLAIVLIGNSKPSQMYARFMMKVAENYEIRSEIYEKSEDATEDDVKKLIEELNQDNTVTGILPMMPLPKGMRAEEIIKCIDPDKDIDGLTTTNAGRLFTGKEGLFGCTPRAVMAILDYYEIQLEGKKVVVMGRSNVIGKPVAQMLLDRNATVTICHSHTKNIKEITKKADIIIVAVGRPQSLTADMVNTGAVVIDVGINRVEGVTVGDVDYEHVKEIAGAITPVPGGVGSVTTTMVIESLVKVGKQQRKNDRRQSE